MQYWIYKKSNRDFYLAKTSLYDSMLEIKNPWNDKNEHWYNDLKPANFNQLCPLGPFENAQDAFDVISSYEEEIVENYGILEGTPRASICSKLEDLVIENRFINMAQMFLKSFSFKKEKLHFYLNFELPSHIQHHNHVDFYRFEISPEGNFAGQEKIHSKLVPKAIAASLKYRGGLTVKKITPLGPLVSLQNGQTIKIHQKIVYGIYLGQSQFTPLSQQEIKSAYLIDVQTGKTLDLPRSYSFRHAKEILLTV